MYRIVPIRIETQSIDLRRIICTVKVVERIVYGSGWRMYCLFTTHQPGN